MATMAGTKTLNVEVAMQGVATLAEAGEFLKLSRSTLYGLMDSGQLAYSRFGKSRRIPWSELQRYVEASTTTATRTN